MSKIILFDGHSILNRAFYGIPDLTNSKGIHTNAVYGFLNIMLKIMEEEKPDYITVAFDVKQKTFRHELFSEYKGTRKPMPQELHEQVPIIKEVLNSMGINTVELPGFEADDILGTIAFLCEGNGMEVAIISGDRDLLQLATDNIKIRIPKTKKGTTIIEDYYSKDVFETYQVTPKEFIELKALMGDTADNIPGAKGIGEKTATAIIKEFHSIENIYDNIEAVMPNKARNSLIDNESVVRLSKTLATINTNAPVDFRLEQAVIGNLFNQNSYALFKQYEFKSLLKKFDNSNNTGLEDIISKIEIVNDFEKANDLFNKAAKLYKNKSFIFDVINGDVFRASFILNDTIYVIEELFLLTKDLIVQELNRIIEASSNCIVKNIKAILKEGINCPQNKFFDIEIGAYLLNPLKDNYNYDDLLKDYKEIILPTYDELKKNYSLDIALSYVVALNVYAINNTYVDIKNQLVTEGMYDLYSQIEHPLIYVLNDMEKFGIKVDKEALSRYSQKLGIRIDELEKEIYLKAGSEFNINSPKQLGEVLFERLGLPGGKKTKTGYSTSAEVLEKLKEDNPIIKDILEYRQLTKLKSTYADGLVNYISTDNRIHSRFNQTITATGRISSTDPNLQNIPIRMELGRLIRKVFVPEEDYIFVDADYSQIELRILAHMADDDKLIEAYNNSLDIHRITASQVFHIPLEEVTDLQRRNAKAVNFGIIYGISSFGLSQDLSISRKEATDYIESYFETYPKIKLFLDTQVINAKKDGYTRTLYNRKRPIPELSSSNFMQRSFGERIAMNSPIQGTAADIIKIAMIKVNNELKDRGLKSRLILQIHDELLIECHKDEIEEVKVLLANNMKEACSLKVSLEVDMHTGNDWFEAK